ncbi:hypothetical protein GGX14DRAFT_599184 [Mycena pura]|uniref:WW domain-containing protein n=1 Tax=Mycena pura TaxID=153505 RepID=A0AAD6YJ63_9AGAR|nr:hypothetical protein GGX14DRAFT_599184 [Mycena pura]
MPDLKSPQGPTNTVRAHRTASTETLPQYSTVVTSGEEDSRQSLEDAAMPLPSGWYCHFDAHSNHHYYVDMNSSPPRSVWQHPRRQTSPPHQLPGYGASESPPKRKGFLGKLKEKMKDLEAEARQEEARKQQILLERYAKRRDEVLAELAKDGKINYGGNHQLRLTAAFTERSCLHQA